MPVVGWILIAVAAVAVGGVLYLVMREHAEPEEYFIPPPAGSAPKPSEDPQRTADKSA
ncbi:MAG: hypothetical protein IT319_10345 [Anaerolineae bacterium]|nr:hypothetical protein [Anaerolineae bacterium]